MSVRLVVLRAPRAVGEVLPPEEASGDLSEGRRRPFFFSLFTHQCPQNVRLRRNQRKKSLKHYSPTAKQTQKHVSPAAKEDPHIFFRSRRNWCGTGETWCGMLHHAFGTYVVKNTGFTTKTCASATCHHPLYALVVPLLLYVYVYCMIFLRLAVRLSLGCRCHRAPAQSEHINIIIFFHAYYTEYCLLFVVLLVLPLLQMLFVVAQCTRT